MANFSIYPAIINGVTLPNIKMLDPDVGNELITVDAGGQIDPVRFGLAFQDSKAPFETNDFPGIFTALGMSLPYGLACANGATLQFQRADNGVFSAGATHASIASPKGYCYIDEITADQDAKTPATIKGQYCFLYSAGAFATLSNTAALTGSPGLSTFYALGPIYHNGAKVVGVQRSRLTTGIRYTTVRADGETQAGEGKVEDRLFQLECDLNNLDTVFNNPLGWGILPSSGSVVMYLRKCISGGDRVADAVAEHVAVAFNVSTVEFRGVKKGSKSDALATLIFHMHREDNAVSGVSIALDSTIP